MPEKATKQPEPIRLTTACVINGRYYRAGEPLPFANESEVPPNLAHLIGEPEVPWHPCERDYYSPEIRRQAAQVRGNVQWQDAAEVEAEAAQQLPPEVKEVLEEEYSRRIQKLKAQKAYDQSVADDIYAAAEAQAAAKESRYFVKRGGEFARVERAKLKPGETCFVKRENGEYEAAGLIDAAGAPPPPEIIP
jgi:hypothetical protein